MSFETFLLRHAQKLCSYGICLALTPIEVVFAIVSFAFTVTQKKFGIDSAYFLEWSGMDVDGQRRK